MLAHHRHHHRKAEEAVDHAGDARQQVDRRRQRPQNALGAKAGHEDGGKQRDRHAHDQRAGGDVDGAEDHRQNAVDVVAGPPGGAAEEVKQADLAQSRYGVAKEEHADQNDADDRHAGRHGEHAVHQPLAPPGEKALESAGGVHFMGVFAHIHAPCAGRKAAPRFDEYLLHCQSGAAYAASSLQSVMAPV